MRIKFVGKAVQACGKVAGRLHLGLRGQILLLGVAGVVVVGAIYLAGLQVEQRSQREAERFGKLEGLTAKVSESLLQAREIATQFLQKPNDKKVATHDETVKAAIERLASIEAIAEKLPDGRSAAAGAVLPPGDRKLHHALQQCGLGAEADRLQRE